MKRYYLLLILLQLSLFSSAQWNNIYQDSSLDEVLDLYFFNKDTGLVCGINSYGGYILRTHDGGLTWQNTSNYAAGCYAIDFINDSVGYSGGQDGGVFKTTDGGVTWDFLTLVVGFHDFEDLIFLNDSVGLVKLYEWSIYKTTDSGMTWSEIPGTNDIGSNLLQRKNNSFCFINDSIGFITGEYVVSKTTDQGDTWSYVVIDSTHYFRAIYMFNEMEGFAVGNEGVIISTNDGWLSWATDSVCGEDLRDIQFISDSIGFIVGGGEDYNDDTVGVVLRTVDRGSNWEVLTISENRLNSFQFIDSVAYTVGNNGKIFKNEVYSNLLNTEKITTEKNNFKAWPVPADRKLFFNLMQNQTANIELLDLNGKTISGKYNSGENWIDTSSLPNGFYILKVIMNDMLYTSKVIVNHN